MKKERFFSNYILLLLYLTISYSFSIFAKDAIMSCEICCGVFITLVVKAPRLKNYIIIQLFNT